MPSPLTIVTLIRLAHPAALNRRARRTDWPSAPVSAHSKGQALVEFALVSPVLVFMLLTLIQFGILFWAQITLTQIARDAGRWAASQPACAAASVDISGQANDVASRSLLFSWNETSNRVVVYSGPTWTDATPAGGTLCPPPSNQEVWTVRFGLRQTVPVFFPFVADTCSPTCTRSIQSSVQFRVEPAP